MTKQIVINVPDNWLEEHSTMRLQVSILDEAREALRREAIKQILDKYEFPNIEIPESELRADLKDRILDKLVDRALWHGNDNS